jgi:hypothetical protein
MQLRTQGVAHAEGLWEAKAKNTYIVQATAATTSASALVQKHRPVKQGGAPCMIKLAFARAHMHRQCCSHPAASQTAAVKPTIYCCG